MSELPPVAPDLFKPLVEGLAETVKAAHQSLPLRLRQVRELRARGLTYEMIGLHFGITGVRARQLFLEGEARIRRRLSVIRGFGQEHSATSPEEFETFWEDRRRAQISYRKASERKRQETAASELGSELAHLLLKARKVRAGAVFVLHSR
jgi:hypothetical protein